MNKIARLLDEPHKSSIPAVEGNGPSDAESSGLHIKATDNAGSDLDMVELDKLEQSLALEIEREFGHADEEQPQTSEETVEAPRHEDSVRLLDIKRKRAMSADIEQRVREGATLFGSLTKQVSILTGYLDKTEGDLKRLEKVEANANRLRIASESISRKNQEMKSTLDEQKKRIALLEGKIAALRESNEQARTNLARLTEEKRVASVDLSGLRGEISRLESDRESLAERLDNAVSEHAELRQSLEQIRERERVAAGEARQKDEEIARLTEELEEIRESRKQKAIDLEELKNRNSTLETASAEQKSRIDELMFELESGRKEFDEIIRLKQQRILELEARTEGQAKSRHEFSEDMTPSMSFDPAKERSRVETAKPSKEAKPRPKAPAKATAKS